MKKTNSKSELEDISHFFISSKEEKEPAPEDLNQFTWTYAGQAEDDSELEETVNVRKRIAFPDTGDAQENVKRCLFRHLQDDYMICRVELRKSSSLQEPRSQKRKEEEVLIFLK